MYCSNCDLILQYAYLWSIYSLIMKVKDDANVSNSTLAVHALSNYESCIFVSMVHLGLNLSFCTGIYPLMKSRKSVKKPANLELFRGFGHWATLLLLILNACVRINQRRPKQCVLYVTLAVGLQVLATVDKVSAMQALHRVDDDSGLCGVLLSILSVRSDTGRVVTLEWYLCGRWNRFGLCYNQAVCR